MDDRMTKTANPATVVDGDGLARSAGDLHQLWNQILAWFASHYLSIIIAALVAALIVAMLYAIKMFGTRLCRRPHIDHWPRIVGRAVARTNLFFIVMLAVSIVSGYARPPAMVAGTVHFLFVVAAAFQGALWVRELLIGIVEYRAGDDEGSSSTLGSAIGLVRVLVSAVCFIIAMLLILDNIGVNITGLWASLGIGGIAIGLAAQGIFSDLFASLAIIFDKPFHRGDTIKWDKTTATVELIGLKTTRLRSVDGESVVISNTNILSKELHNYAGTMRRRATLTFRTVFHTPPAVSRKIPDLAKAIVTRQDKAAFLHCWLVNLGQSSLDFELLFDVIDADVEVFNRVRHEVCITLLETFAREGIEFAYPAQTTFTAAPDGTLIMPYPAEPEAEPEPGKIAAAKAGKG
jgi:small-conductance mechanosensitive channel